MFKELLKVISFLSIFIIGGNLIALCQNVTNKIPSYMFLLTLVGFIIVMWYNVVKLMISINEGE